MIRFLIVALTVIGFLIFSAGILWKQKRLGKKDRDQMERESLSTVQKVFRLLLRIAKVQVTIKGWERVPKDQPVLYVGNHRSYFDILVGYTTVPGLMGFVAKKEMHKIPLLSGWMTNVNCLFLDRKNLKEGLKTILEGIDKVKRGVSIWIFPEGTRNRNDDILDLLPFKEGSLKIAEKSGCPVVPVAITGTADIFEKHLPRITPGKVVIEFGEPFIVKELPPEDRKFAGAYTKKLIIEMLKRERDGLTGDQEEAGCDRCGGGEAVRGADEALHRSGTV